MMTVDIYLHHVVVFYLNYFITLILEMYATVVVFQTHLLLMVCSRFHLMLFTPRSTLQVKNIATRARPAQQVVFCLSKAFNQFSRPSGR